MKGTVSDQHLSASSCSFAVFRGKGFSCVITGKPNRMQKSLRNTPTSSDLADG